MPAVNAEEAAALAAYDRLRQDAAEWAAYLDERRLSDRSSGDGIEPAFSEYPEYNKGGALS